ncbi:uncharacterized protein LOC143205736 [Rhynchophorus ferrugineus]|uniref:uncharacterized protein LOC143205736 n=1 Tax=Rhynchophorus ferrugineus TaxID=354439 RepID=UPI003FCD7BC1
MRIFNFLRKFAPITQIYRGVGLTAEPGANISRTEGAAPDRVPRKARLVKVAPNLLHRKESEAPKVLRSNINYHRASGAPESNNFSLSPRRKRQGQQSQCALADLHIPFRRIYIR